jgi:hypothetical protein
LFALTGEHRNTIARMRDCTIMHELARIIVTHL